MIKLKKGDILFYVLIVIGVAIFIGTLLFQDILHKKKHEQMPVIEKGYLDLSDWNFEKDGNVELDGDWDFYWSEFIDPVTLSEQNSNDAMSGKELMKVPSNWRKGGKLGNDYLRGYATYHLKIKVSSEAQVYGIKIQNIRSSNTLFVDGVQVGGSGIPADNFKERVMGNVPYMAHFSSQGPYVDIVIHVSEYENRTGGLVKSITFGQEKSISLMNLRAVFFDTLTVAALMVIGIIFAGLYLYWRRDKSALYLALYCFTFSFFLLTYNEKIVFQIFPLLAYLFVQNVQHVVIYLSFSFILLFMNASNDVFFPKKILWVYLWIYGLFMIFIFFTPYSLYAKYSNLLYLLALLSYVIMIFNLAKVLMLKKYRKEAQEGTAILFFSAIFITMNLISSIQDASNFSNNFVVAQITIFLFVGTAALYITKKHSDAYSKIEILLNEFKKVDRFKDEFLVYTAHEFKTPLNGIINITQAIVESDDNNLSSNQAQNLGYVKAIATRLSSLVNDILDIQSIKDNKFKLHLAAVDISAPLQTVVEVLRQIYEDKGLDIINKVPSNTYFTIADEYRLRQIFNNLIGNALKYTQQGHVMIRAELANDCVLIYVEDTGVGIDKEQFESVFQYFEYSVSKPEFGHHSSGVGLSLSRKLAEQMDGHINLTRSEVGIGSEFCLCLPVANIQTQVDSRNKDEKIEQQVFPIKMNRRRTDQENGSSTYTILVVDDEATNIEAVKAVLDRKNYKIVSAYNGQQALDLIELNRSIDAVLLDVMMPGISGFETLIRIRDSYTAIDLPVLIMSVKNDADSITYGLTIGANDYLTKPFEASELLARIQNCVEIKETYKKMVGYELSFLQAQIKPHFIFNALAIIASLSVKEPTKAKEIVLDLADYLRLSFDFENNSGLTTLENEISLVKAYLSIEQARFTTRLNIEYDIEEGIDCTLPVLCIQPLVENAVRHGIMKNTSFGYIKLMIKWVDDYILISIEDNGAGVDLESIKALLSGISSRGHVGVRNINNRLYKLYGEGLQYERGTEVGTKVSFKIPYVSKEEINEHTDC